MSRLYYNQSPAYVPPVDQIIEDIKRTGADEIVIMCVREWECVEINIEFSNKLKEFNVKIIPVYGSSKTDYYDNRHKEAQIPIDNAVFWETAWIYNVEYFTKEFIDRYQFKKEFKHKFISLNNRSHLHRCMFMDQMAKHNLIDKGIVTWIKHLNENNNYPYEYYDNTQRLLDDNFANHLDSMKLPKEYTESFFQIITESQPDKMLITEKTGFALVMRKPFVVVGSKGFHQKLVDLGFKLYDEIIDYSFDSFDTIEDRIAGVVQNVQRIVDCNTMEIYNLIKPKILHNYIRMLELTHDSSVIPEIVKQYSDAEKDNDITCEMFLNFFNRKPKKDKIISIWGNSVLDSIQDIKDNNETISQVIIDVSTESPYHHYESIVDICNSFGIPTVFLTSTYTYNKNLLDWNDKKFDNTLVIDWPAFWITKGTDAMCDPKHYLVNCNNGLDINKPDAGLGVSVNHLYITMNNLASPHRCVVMDYLAKHNLIEHGAISWRDVIRSNDSTRTEIVCENEYHGWKYWTPKKMILDFPMDLTSLVEQARLPPQYAHSFMQLVTESNPTNFFITEKTTVPLMFNKLFLVAGSKNFHLNLKDMGFELYDELFDYSFDNIDDIELRYEGIVKNIQRYSSKTNLELEQIIDSMKDKLMRNKAHAVKLAREIPTAFLEMAMRITLQNSNSPLSYINNIKELEIFKKSNHVRY